ncbi:hypothetical protein [Lysinibacillus fusiformis]|uniref:hypothetical protein n=1 Tax=Lysinibacillus fusiformis TaxID=28031 RepID=UPI003558DD46
MAIKLIESSSISGLTRTVVVNNGLKDDFIVVGIYINGAGSKDPSLPSGYIKIGSRAGNGVYLYYRRLTASGSFSITSAFPANNTLFTLRYWLFRGAQDVNLAIDYPLKLGTTTTYTRSFNDFSDVALVTGDGTIGFKYSIYKNVTFVSETLRPWAVDAVPIIILSTTLTGQRVLFQEGEVIKTYNDSSWQVAGTAPVSKYMFDSYGITMFDLQSYNRVGETLREQMTDSDFAICSGRLFSKTIDFTRYVDIKNLEVDGILK